MAGEPVVNVAEAHLVVGGVSEAFIDQVGIGPVAVSVVLWRGALVSLQLGLEVET